MDRKILEIKIISLIEFLFYHSNICTQFKNSASPTRPVTRNSTFPPTKFSFESQLLVILSADSFGL